MISPATFFSGMTGWKRQATAFFCGGLSAFALPPFNIAFIGFVTFPIFVLLLDGICNTNADNKQHRKAALTGWSFGFGYFVFGLWWLSHAMLIDPVAFAWAIPFAIFGLPAFLALYWALASFIASFLWTKGMARFFALAFAFGLCEWLRGVLFTGFPWNAIGYTAMPFPILMQSSSIFGLYGMNALAVLAYSLATVLFSPEKKTGSIILLSALLAGHIGFGLIRLSGLPPAIDQPKEALWVRIIQPSIKQEEKLDGQTRLTMFETHLNLSMAPPKTAHPMPSFIVWPETSVPYILESVPAAKMRIASILQPQQWAIVGAVRTDTFGANEADRYFNTIEVIDGNSDILLSSDKSHLVPFGEYLPFQSLFDKIGLRAIADATGGYSAAKGKQTATLPNGFSYLPLICYEIIFPTEMNYNGLKPQAILNVTNDGWFGITPGPYQHFQQARIRAVEQGLPLIRAANNGISAVVDPYGRIVDALGQDKIGFIDAPIPYPAVSIWNKGPGLLAAFGIFGIFLCLSYFIGRKFR